METSRLLGYDPEIVTRPIIVAAIALLALMTHMSAAPDVPSDPREKLVLANKILAMEGLIGPFGHVSLRIGPTRFLINTHETVGVWVNTSDLGEIETSVTPENVRERGLYSEIFIHSAAYQEYPHINAVVHTHSPYAIALGTLPAPEEKVLPTTNPGSNLGNFIPIFSQVGLVQTPVQGGKVVRALQGQNGVLLRGHGAVIVGESLEQAVLRAIYLELEARMQMISRPAGEPRFFKPEESDQFKGTRSIDHPWEYYVQKVKRLDKEGS